MSAVVTSAPVPSTGARRHASHRSGEQASSKPTLFLVTAHHDFKSTDPDQLPFGKGDILEIVRVDAATGWAAARRPASSKIGWIPRSFVTTIKEPTTTPTKTVDISLKLAQPRLPNSKTERIEAIASSPPRSSAFLANVTSSTTTSAAPRQPLPQQTLRLHTNLATVGSAPPSPLSDADALMYFSPSTFTPSSRTSRKASTWRTQPSSAHPFAVGLEWAAPEEKPKPQGLDLPAPEDIFGPLPSIDRSVSRTRSASVDTRSGAGPRQRSRSNAATSRAISVLPNRLGDIVEGALSVRSRATSTSNDSQIFSTTSSSSSNPTNKDSPSLIAVDAASSSGSSSQRERSGSVQNHPVTLSQLIDALLKEHNKPTSCDDISFCSIFFTTFRTFATPEALFDRLKYHYTRTASIDSRQGNVVLVQVVNALRCWITHQALSQESGPVATAVSRFLLDINSHRPQLPWRKTRFWPSNSRYPPPGLEPPVTTSKTTKYQGADELFKIPVSVVAEHLCLYEHRIYSRILPTDCVIYAKSQSAQETARIQRFCATSDRIASLVKHSVLVEPLAKRVSAIEFWVKVAQRCLAMFNAASGCAIVAALSSADISRLKQTWNSVSSSTNQTLKSAKRFIDPQANHRAMRTFLRDADGPCVPYIGMFLRDLVHLHESMPEPPESSPEPAISEPLINWNKRRRLAVTVWMILQHQKDSYVFSEDRVVAELSPQGWIARVN
ncbi:ras guanine nucleotide exchange factor domain-containing protein [Auriculariales sp. MPI-PUGE-AT-0066]|nr:ras guanine nucleotide exchange factor domain-containing protein [Auriculariales sp. MPI-PUGE-AT-0066]